MRKQTENRIENQGFSLLTVIVAVSFIGILGLLVLYMSLANFNMKVTDIKGKNSFYTAEQALEEIYENNDTEKIAEILKKRHYNPEQPDAKEMQKQYGYLMRRGYKSEDILRVMKCPDYLT